MNDQNIAKSRELYGHAKRGQWKDVIDKYKEYKEVFENEDYKEVLKKYKENKEVLEKYKEVLEKYNPKLNRRGDTVLHLAVIDNQEAIVEELVKIVEVLEITNESGNNSLHLAAMMGSVRMCEAIASKHNGLVDRRNNDDKTPLFLAAAYGNKDAFFCLYNFCRDDASRISANCRVKQDGDTVLHNALSDEHFDLAFQLINMHKEAISWVNEAGLTPIHVLARKPTSFKSGSHIKGWQHIVYHCSFVKPLQPRSFEKLKQESERSTEKAKETAPPSPFPVNYQTCIHFFRGMKDIILTACHFKCHNNNDTNNDGDGKKNIAKNDGDKRNGDLEEQKPLNTKSATEPPTTDFPVNYTTCIDFFHIAFSAIMIILGFGSTEIKKIRKKKEKHTWSVQVMAKLLELAEPDKYTEDGNSPMDSKFRNDEENGVTLPYNFVDNEVQFSNFFKEPKELEKPQDVEAPESAMLLAARNGVIEIVKGTLERFPLAIRDTRKDKKNVVLLAAEHRQPDVYRLLLKKGKEIQNLFRAVDHEGNSALHLAATAIDPKLWRITGAALQMQWEVKWYKYVKGSVPLHFFPYWNHQGKTASAIFRETHKELATKGGAWLYSTSESCSLVATLIATVAFATAATIPGGNDETGGAKLGDEQGFLIFSYSSLIALCLSSTSVIMFLAIMTSRFDIKDFGLALPWKLLIGLCCLYFSIIAMLVSFCSGHYFLIIKRLHNEAILLYTLTFFPVALIFGIVQLPLYFDLLQALIKRVPRRSAEVVLCDLSVRCGTSKNKDCPKPPDSLLFRCNG
ncbi:uncharacterized protein LOC111437341 isoform X1 [Cucurbita moschata]|uniref:Uncharacterized protein LOC111437341 isoform X1 n=1 Tax=Cucurbita moschata TaxID=3662 RepID=A0A6J1EX64_CUCMO|nr:uncharacterized protein LOC111437341 isoform X1 [Cucurbita moschata]